MCEMCEKFKQRQEDLMTKIEMFCDEEQKHNVYERGLSAVVPVTITTGLAKLLHPLMDLLEHTNDNEFDPDFIGELMRLRMTFALHTPIANAMLRANLRDICNAATEVQISTMEALVP